MFTAARGRANLLTGGALRGAVRDGVSIDLTRLEDEVANGDFDFEEDPGVRFFGVSVWVDFEQ